jgi:hypothetical protein
MAAKYPIFRLRHLKIAIERRAISNIARFGTLPQIISRQSPLA